MENHRRPEGRTHTSGRMEHGSVMQRRLVRRQGSLATTVTSRWTVPIHPALDKPVGPPLVNPRDDPGMSHLLATSLLIRWLLPGPLLGNQMGPLSHLK